MAVVQRALLVEAPVRFAYDCWSDFERYPSFMEGVGSVAMAEDGSLTWAGSEGTGSSWTGKLVDRVEGSRVAWDDHRVPPGSVAVTFSALEGNATWMVMSIDFTSLSAEETDSEFIDTTGRRIERDLRASREVIERAYEESRRG